MDTPLFDADALVRRLFVERRPNHLTQPRGDTLYGFPEEHSPPEGGGLVRVASHPWLLVSWERLRVPRIAERLGPRRCRPYCWGVRSVTFHVAPLRVAGGGGRYRAWCEVEHALTHGDVVEHGGETFRFQTGRVVWREGAFWFRAVLRREARP